jgi:hypothetical protein
MREINPRKFRQMDMFAHVAALKADIRSAGAVLQTGSDVVHRDDFASVVFIEMISDIILISERLRRDSPDMRKAFGYSDGIRLSATDLTDMCYSAAATAGFTAFLRPDDRWTLYVCRENDPRGMIVIAELHRLRAELARNMRGILALLRYPRMDPGLRRALANLCVALRTYGSAVDGREMMTFAQIPLSSRDPQGDAMVAGEEHENFGHHEDLTPYQRNHLHLLPT